MTKTLNNRARKHIARLTRRRDYLIYRAATHQHGDKATALDQAEAAALSWALAFITASTAPSPSDSPPELT